MSKKNQKRIAKRKKVKDKKQRKEDKKKEKNKISGSRKAEMLKRGNPARTANGRKIFEFMLYNGVKGNFRDYVLFSGDTFIDWLGSYKAVTESGDPVKVEGVALIHKKKLHNFLGEEAALKFWHPKFGRLGAEKVRRDGKRKDKKEK